MRRRGALGPMLMASLAVHGAAVLAFQTIRIGLPAEPPAVEIMVEVPPPEPPAPEPKPPEPPPPEPPPPEPPPPEPSPPEPAPPEPPPPTRPAQTPAPPVAKPPPPRPQPQPATPQPPRAPSAAPAPPVETPEPAVRIEGAVLGPDWIRQLQEWWDLHAYYPREAIAKGLSGAIKVHLVVHGDGEVWIVKVLQGSGSETLDRAGIEVFLHGHLRPFPPGTPAPQAEVTITMRYALRQPGAADAPKRPFTVTDAPVKGTVVDKMQQRVCTGVVVEGGWGPNSFLGTRVRVEAVFYRNPDGAPWVRWTSRGGIVVDAPVIEQGVAAHWYGIPALGPAMNRGPKPRYAIWPAGDNRLGGTSDDPRGSIDLTCE